MKTMKQIVITVLAGITLTACDGMMDFHQKYVEGGEIVYLPPPQSVEFLAGKDRVVVKIAFYNSPNTKSIDVYWNNAQDSLIYLLPAPLSAGADTVYVSVPLEEEKGYNFTVYSTDAHGNRSLPSTGFGTAYGAMYQSSLSNQPMRRIALSDDGGMLQWSLKSEGLYSKEVSYRKNDNLDSVVTTPADTTTTILPNAKSASQVTYRSSFLPEPTAIDTFYTAWQQYETPFPAIILLNKAHMTAVLCSSEQVNDGGGMQSILTDDPTTFWHSGYQGTVHQYPHWIVVDMGKSHSNIVKIELFRRLGNTDTKNVNIYVSATLDAPANPVVAPWQYLGNVLFTYDSSPLYESETLDIPSGTDTSGRYLLLYLPDGNRAPYNSLSRLDIYTD
ncbi:DUF4998 domain-containing protein [Candidatus Symbiothrix dinenymphae]|uniref:DUF4998 domain-containing protein n=1 Tax=Candidatus Symbiothrix dinenymphae TaxID=467085 RepID=UPI0009E71952|nr:DUF4998 domain-containing protein [Candidatus Symbiothrix dinenymphae]